MFPLKPKDEGIYPATKRGPEARWGLFAGIMLILLLTIPYIINVETNASMTESPSGNLNEFLNMQKKVSTDQLSEAHMDTYQQQSAISNTMMMTQENIDMRTDQATVDSITNVSSGDTDTVGKTTYTEQDNSGAGSHNTQNKALRGINTHQDQHKVLTISIYGSKIEQRIGNQSPGKACVVFYSHDLSEIESGATVLSTKICPDKRDRHIEFHMRGIFSTHPHAPGGGTEAQVRVQYIHAGSGVWTTFFAQHDDKHGTVVVPPGASVHLTELTSNHNTEFYEEFDSVRVLYTREYVSSTRGHQHTFPNCVQFYESRRVDMKTKGFMACGDPSWHKKELEFSLGKLEKLHMSPQNADTNGITSINVGANVLLRAYSGKDLDGDELEVKPATSVDMTVVARVSKDDGKDKSWNKKVKSFRMKFMRR